MSRKPKKDDFDFDESLPYILGVGSYQIVREDMGKKVKPIKIVGFVRPKRTEARKRKAK